VLNEFWMKKDFLFEEKCGWFWVNLIKETNYNLLALTASIVMMVN